MEGASSGGGGVDGAEPQKKFQCPVCPRSFNVWWNVAAHFSVHDRAGEVTAVQRRQFLKTGSGVRGSMYPAFRGYECNFCHTLFDTIKELQTHYEQRRRDMNEGRMGPCVQTKSSIELLEQKIKDLQVADPPEEEKNHICPVCDKRFKKTNYLTKHMITHSKNRRRFKCGVCKVTVSSARILKAHQNRLHLKSPTGYKCGPCNTRFFTRFELESHRQKIHVAARPLGCTFCSKRFSKKKDLDIHIRRHTGERPYLCEFCGLSFVRNCDLKRHQERHNREDS